MIKFGKKWENKVENKRIREKKIDIGRDNGELTFLIGIFDEKNI